MGFRWRDDWALVAVLVTLLALTGVVLVDPDVAPAFVNAPLDLVLGAAAALIAVAVASLAWIHHREGGDTAALFRAAAFLVLAAQNLALLAIPALGRASVMGMELSAPGQLPLWWVIACRAVAAALLAAAGLAALSPQRLRSALRPTPWVVLLAPTVAVGLIAAILVAGRDSLPSLLGSAALATLQRDPTAPLLGEAGLGLIALQVLIGLGFLAAAMTSYRLWHRSRRRAELYLAIGFVLAAFSQVHAGIHPGAYASLVTTGDLLRVAFYAVLLVAAASEARDDVRALRTANAELLRLRDVEVARATADERARLAREIHDGMSQELWYAKLKQSRLAAMDDLPAEGRELAAEVATAIDSALLEARQAILALRPAGDASFGELLGRFVQEFADRFGIAAECQVETAADGLSSRHQAELLRIVQEALTNVRRHADATRVRVSLVGTDDGVTLNVSDNGRGFRPEQVDGSRYGLGSMRERAGIIGGRLRIVSAPSDGASVIVQLAKEGGR
jgi:signal transduction histidine kinase